MAVTNITPGPQSFVISPVSNRLAPCEGPMAASVLCDFSQAPQYTLNGQQLVQQNRLCQVQAVYIDASGTDNPTTVLIPSIMSIIVKGRTQGWYPVTCGKPWNLIITNTDGAVKMNITLANFPVAMAQWPTQ